MKEITKSDFCKYRQYWKCLVLRRGRISYLDEPSNTLPPYLCLGDC